MRWAIAKTAALRRIETGVGTLQNQKHEKIFLVAIVLNVYFWS